MPMGMVRESFFVAPGFVEDEFVEVGFLKGVPWAR
jgi:hypothetical protein